MKIPPISKLRAINERNAIMNRGRIQAQGSETEKSNNWALETDHSKANGLESVTNVENQLTLSEKRVRTKAISKCRKRINTTPPCGVSSPMKKSYFDNPAKKEIRIDIEVNAGIAFKG